MTTITRHDPNGLWEDCPECGGKGVIYHALSAFFSPDDKEDTCEACDGEGERPIMCEIIGCRNQATTIAVDYDPMCDACFKAAKEGNEG
jgi:DnaJ-class molecular chaperone